MCGYMFNVRIWHDDKSVSVAQVRQNYNTVEKKISHRLAWIGSSRLEKWHKNGLVRTGYFVPIKMFKIWRRAALCLDVIVLKWRCDKHLWQKPHLHCIALSLLCFLSTYNYVRTAFLSNIVDFDLWIIPADILLKCLITLEQKSKKNAIRVWLN